LGDAGSNAARTTPGFVFGPGPHRSSGPRHIAMSPLGRIAFAGQDAAGTPSVECAIASGERAVKETPRYL
jgi:hypothetical protein